MWIPRLIHTFCGIFYSAATIGKKLHLLSVINALYIPKHLLPLKIFKVIFLYGVPKTTNKN